MTPRPSLERGVATLVVVMVLFFVVAMVAAYTSRNLIFEQKTSANQYRSTVAFEAAEAGVDWTLAMLNGGLINGNCGPSTTLPGTSFQQRYLRIVSNPTSNPLVLPGGNGTVDESDRNLVPLPAPDPRESPDFWPACSINGMSWGSLATCRCPYDAASSPTVVQVPSFRAWLARPSTPAVVSPPTLFNLQVNGCTRMPAIVQGRKDCLDQDVTSLPPGVTLADLAGDAMATMRVVVALRSSMASMPSAALTVQGNLSIAPSGAPVHLVNTDSVANGVTAHAGGTLPLVGLDDAIGLPGTPAAASLVKNDSRLLSLSTLATGGIPVTDSRMFISQFGMKPNTYRDQPGARVCPGFIPACTAAALQVVLATHPQRVLWIDGDLTLDANLGTDAAPVLLIVNGGSLTLNANVTVVGLVYVVGTAPGTPGPLQATVAAPDSSPAAIRGALIAGGSLQVSYGGTPTGTNGLTVTYDRAVLNLLRTTYGSWVRLPGGWRDFKD